TFNKRLILYINGTIMKEFRSGNSRILTHVVFWSVFILFTGCVWGYCNDEGTARYFPQSFEEGFAELPLIAGLVYLNLYVLLPRFFVTRKYTKYALLLVAVYLFTAICIRLLQVYYINVKYPAAWDENRLLDIYYIR